MGSTLLLAAAIVVEMVSGDPTRVVVRVADVSGDVKLALHRVAPGIEPGGPGMFGTSARSGSDLVFSPAMRLTPGQIYTAILTGNDRELARHAWTVPVVTGPAPTVVMVHPTAPVLPANLLKFYLQFSEPMRESQAVFDHFHLELPDGSRVEDPWRRQELWNAEGTRLTLWIHPGRVKRGVNLREELGPVLLPGQSYTLVIEPGPGLLSLTGQTLEAPFRLAFRTGPEIHGRPDPATWSLGIPRAGTREPLVVAFPEPLDHALVRRHLGLAREDGGELPELDLVIPPGDSTCHMTPVSDWPSGSYLLTAGPWLEDLAGNTPERIFDRDLSDPEPETLTTTIAFSIRP